MFIERYDVTKKPNVEQKKQIADFLYCYLEQYGDELSAIHQCIDYALEEDGALGGFILTAQKEEELTGVVIVNQTGMKEYIPENILVYIATHSAYRGQGIGKKMIQETVDNCQGNIALHVEPDNPAKFLYEKMGFENKYLEMRLVKN